MICPEFVICEIGSWCRHAKPHPIAKDNPDSISKKHATFADCKGDDRLCPGCIDIEEDDGKDDLSTVHSNRQEL